MEGATSRGRGPVWAGLVASVGTLVCCALPSLLVLLGFGTMVAAAVSAAPWLVVLSRHKGWLFLAAGILIAGSRWYAAYVVPRISPEGAACPLPLSRLTRALWWTSASLYAAGLFVAYALGPLLQWLDP